MKLALFMNRLGVTASNFKVDVYRDGQTVTLVAKGKVQRNTEDGKIVTSGVITQQYETVKAYENDRDALFNRYPLAYTKMVGRLGIDDDVRKALPLPENLKYLLNDKQLMQNNDAQVVVQTETSGRPFLK